MIWKHNLYSLHHLDDAVYLTKKNLHLYKAKLWLFVLHCSDGKSVYIKVRQSAVQGAETTRDGSCQLELSDRSPSVIRLRSRRISSAMKIATKFYRLFLIWAIFIQYCKGLDFSQ